MGDLLEFRALTRRRPKPDRAYALVISDLQSCASDIQTLIEEWKLKEVEASSCQSAVAEIEAVGRTISDCVTNFVTSAGNWHGRWPRFAWDGESGGLSARCANHVRWSLSRRIQVDFMPKIIEGYQRAADIGGPLNFEVESDPWTLLAMKNFIREIGEEIKHQSLSAEVPKRA